MAYCWLSRLHHARSSGGRCNSPVLPTPGSQSPCAVQRLAERIRRVSSCSDECRGRRSNLAHDERRLQRRSPDHYPGGSEPDLEHRTSTRPSPRAGTKWVPIIHRTIRSSSDHRGLRRRTGLRRRLETRPQENSCNCTVERYEKNGSIAGTAEGDRRRVYSAERQVLCNRGRDSHALEAASSAPSKLQRTPKRINLRFFRVSDLARNPQPLR